MAPPPASAAPVLTVDLAALADNWRKLARTAAPAECAAVVKADAYGTGADRVASALAAAGCRTFFVATADEGIALRRALGPGARVFVLNGPDEATAAALVAHDAVPVLNDLGQIETWARTARRRDAPLAAALHADTGMNRLGLPPEEVAVLSQEPHRLAGVEAVLTMSHLACADDRDNPGNREQLLSFLRIKGALPAAPASLANSSGIFLGPGYRFEAVRPGAALYGVNPTPSAPNPMAEVVRLHAGILQVRQIDAGRAVGYGSVFRAESPRRIATVALGYADGYLRSLGGRGAGVLGGVRVPVVGRVSMDLLTLDVTGTPEGMAAPGRTVSLIGGGVPVDEVAAAAGTIGYEVLTALGRRIRRVYVSGDERC